MPVPLALTVFLAVTLVAYGCMASAMERLALRRTFRQLAAYGDDDQARHELLEPLHRRALAPVAARAARLGHAFTPSGHVERAARKLVLAGRSGEEALDRFLVLRVVGVVLVPALVVVVGLLPIGRALQFALLVLGALVLIAGPDTVLNREVERRRAAIRAALPDMLDLLSVSVEAGLGLEQAFERVAADVAGPLSEELRRLQGDIRAGATRAAALRALTERVDVPELRSFVSAVLQADTFGVSIGPVLRAQSEEMRVRWRQRVQERAQKAPVKMLVPMVFCIFPALFVVVIGPAIINITSGLD